MAAEYILQIENARKLFHKTVAVDNVSVEVETGEFIALVGPSGCGKTTLLKMIGGFEVPTAGRVMINGQDMAGVPAAQRPTSMVFQRLALFPHKTVEQNIGYPLKLRKTPADEIKQQVAEMLDLMHLKPEYLRRYPRQLSGGEQQRVALARSLISSPTILLLDEPLSALDFKLKKNLQAELKRLHRSLGVTFVHVTHDLEEAMILADRICVMRDGNVIQVGKPADIYYRPADNFVASFIGETNVFDISVEDVSAEAVRYSGRGIEDSDPNIERAKAANDIRLGAAEMMVRPELVRILRNGESADCRTRARVDEVFVKGSSLQYRAKMIDGGARLVFEMLGTPILPVDVDQEVTLGWNKADVFVFQHEPGETPSPEESDAD